MNNITYLVCGVFPISHILTSNKAIDCPNNRTLGHCNILAVSVVSTVCKSASYKTSTQLSVWQSISVLWNAPNQLKLIITGGEIELKIANIGVAICNSATFSFSGSNVDISSHFVINSFS